jgi:hypothetical protein
MGGSLGGALILAKLAAIGALVITSVLVWKMTSKLPESDYTSISTHRRTQRCFYWAWDYGKLLLFTETTAFAQSFFVDRCLLVQSCGPSFAAHPNYFDYFVV